MKCHAPLVAALLLLLPAATLAQESWKPAAGPLLTRWAANVAPDSVHAEYPRPQMVRDEWSNLNGLWSYALAAREALRPVEVQGKILVPFPIESALSGVMRRVSPEERLWCWRTFEVPEAWRERRLTLHFGAVDWDTEVWVNGTSVGTHRGGYDPFSFDVTDALAAKGPQEVVVAIWDPTDAGYQPRGKQIGNPHGIWYTPTTGIWRTVWIEPTPATAIMRLRLRPHLAAGRLDVGVDARGVSKDHVIEAMAADGRDFYVREVMEGRTEEPNLLGETLYLPIPEAHPWSPDDPFLYDLVERIKEGDVVIDEVRSYFGMRDVALGKDEAGLQRLLLNGEPLFQFGPLDQGFWPDGLYTAPTDEALRYDLEVTKKLGFNMVRKHVKFEPDRWYYWCDVLGLLVWQDMPSGDKYIGGGDPDIERTPESGRNFEMELENNLNALNNHPSIVMWVPYNEGWGQWDTERITKFISGWDPTRLVNNTSGWADRRVGDVYDIHSYPGPAIPSLEDQRAAVLGEFGGLGLPVAGHTWQDEKNWGYRSYESSAALTEAYVVLLDQLRMLIPRGLAAAVYTQTTDVEIEVNGLMTYDRAVLKMDSARVAEAARKLFLPPPIVTPVLPTSEAEGRTWRYTTSDPGEGWSGAGFDDAAWRSGPGGFGTEGTPGAVVRTKWEGSDIWLRRTIELPDDFDPALLHFSIHHDEDVEVYLDGKEVLRTAGYTTSYVLATPTAATRALFTPGAHTLAVHCRQTGGGQYVDFGIVEVRDSDR